MLDGIDLPVYVVIETELNPPFGLVFIIHKPVSTNLRGMIQFTDRISNDIKTKPIAAFGFGIISRIIQSRLLQRSIQEYAGTFLKHSMRWRTTYHFNMELLFEGESKPFITRI